MSDKELTFGERAVGLTFNPSGDPAVHEAKSAYAHVIDRLHELRSDSQASDEQKRLASIAITEAQGAQMWAVKALTWRN
jgi:hypothetical protein